MKSYMLSLVFVCLSACADDTPKFEMVGATDFKVVDDAVCVWINHEPVFHLYQESSYPRISNTYPIKRGRNIISIESVSPKIHLKAESFRPVLFYSNGNTDKFIDLINENNKSILVGAFDAKKDYSVGKGLTLVETNVNTERQTKEWVSQYLSALKSKNKVAFINLFASKSEADPLYEQAEGFFTKEARLLKSMSIEEFNSRRGRSLVYVFGNGKLSDWKIGDSNRHLDGFLFALCAEGLFLRVSGGLWIEIVSPPEKATVERLPPSLNRPK